LILCLLNFNKPIPELMPKEEKYGEAYHYCCGNGVGAYPEK
jgi:hypothetical protein